MNLSVSSPDPIPVMLPMSREPRIRFTVIVPALNEETVIGTCLWRIRDVLPDAEIIVADGESSDQTRSLAEHFGAMVIRGQPGRGCQLNQGAAASSGDVLLFLHADTHLPPNTGPILEDYFVPREAQIGTFRLAFDVRHWFLGASAALTRFDSMFTRFGDQCITVRRSFFKALGGFPDWPIFEDVEFLRRARRLTRIHSFPAAVETSGRRFIRRGIYRQQFLNAYLVLLYLMKRSPEELALRYDQYRGHRRRA
jgi:rSAM/selenodomain-associated transferase 2